MDQTPHEKDSASYVVPGRVTKEELHKQEEELRQAQEVSKAQAKGAAPMFKAMSMYSVAIDFALIIAGPLIILIYAGKWLDKRYNTEYYVLIGIVLALIISSVAIARQVKKLQEFIKRKK